MKNSLKKIILFTGCALVLATLTWQCRKTEALPAETATANTAFTAKAAQDWWWATFRKSPEATQLNRQSPFASLALYGPNGTVQSKLTKLPNFKEAVAYTIGTSQVVEASLVYPANTIFIPGAERQTAEQKQRIAAASLQRVLFIKTASGKIEVRLATLVPTYAYAAAKGFDISHNSFGKLDADFDGFIFTRRWNETPLQLMAVENGRRTKSLTLQPKAADKPGMTDSSTPNTPDECGWEEVEVIRRWCIVAAEEGAENPPPASECTNWHEETSLEWQWVCHEVEDEEEQIDCNNISGMSYDDCMCYYFNLCPGGGGGEEDDCANINLSQLLANATVQSEIEETESTPLNDSIQSRPLKWKILYIANGIGGKQFYSHEQSLIKKNKQTNKWRFENVTHSNISVVNTIGVSAYSATPTVNSWSADIQNTVSFYAVGSCENSVIIDIGFNVVLNMVCPAGPELDADDFQATSGRHHPWAK
jgi:hypothetical protein